MHKGELKGTPSRTQNETDSPLPPPSPHPREDRDQGYKALYRHAHLSGFGWKPVMSGANAFAMTNIV